MTAVRRVMDGVIANSDGDRPMIILGLRGVGKAALLNEFVRQAEQSKRWVAIKIEATPGPSLRETLARELRFALRRTMYISQCTLQDPSAGK